MHEVAFQIRNAEGRLLRGDARWVEAPGRRPVVIVCHGFKGFKDWGFFPWLGRRLAAAGYLAVAFNFSGSGIGPDLLTFDDLDGFAADNITRQIDDLGCILTAVTEGGISAGVAACDRIALLGHSRGGGVAVVRASEDTRVCAVATWAPVSTLQRWSPAEREAWRQQGFAVFLNTRTGQTLRIDAQLLDDLERNAGRFDVLRAAASLHVPLLVVHGGADDSVPAWEGSALAGAAPASPAAEFLLVPGAGHTFGAVHPWQGSTRELEQATRHTLDWLARQPQLWKDARA
jgi:dienelactone hydrolase